MNSCLIVIDVQESFRHRPYFSPTDVPAYLLAQNQLIAEAEANGTPIVRVFHCDGPAEASNAFARESGHVCPFVGLRDFDAALTITKSRHSALVGTGLGVWLTRHAVQRIIVSGIRTEQCCETTARHASDMGWAVDFALDATLTWDMTQQDGSTLSAAQIKSRTATVLHDRFARVCMAAQVFGPR